MMDHNKNKEIIDWVWRKRLPFFFRSPIYAEYKVIGRGEDVLGRQILNFRGTPEDEGVNFREFFGRGRLGRGPGRGRQFSEISGASEDG